MLEKEKAISNGREKERESTRREDELLNKLRDLESEKDKEIKYEKEKVRELEEKLHVQELF